MIKIIKVLGWGLGIIGLISFIAIPLNCSFHPLESRVIDAELASKFGDLFGGFVGTIFSFLSVLLLIYTIINQKKEYKEQQIENRKSILLTNFFRMIDYHNQNVNQLSVPNIQNKDNKSEHRRAFVQYKIQIHRLLILIKDIVSENPDILKAEKEKEKEEDHIAIADIAYTIFYYGIDTGWLPFIKKELERYKGLSAEKLLEKIKSLNSNISNEWINSQKEKMRERHINEKVIEKIINGIERSGVKFKINRTNQTNLSVYFKNMYSAIKMIDESQILSGKEKEELINIYKAQLSNPELYVLLFYLISRFGKADYNENWQKYQNTYKFFDIEKGEIPADYFNIYSEGQCVLKYSEKDCFKIEYKVL